MKTLVDQLLFLARSDSGDQKMLLMDIDLGDMVQEDILQFEPVAFERGILIEPALEPDIHIEGDGTMIKQLIHILLDNACKYASANGTIDVSLKRERQGCTLAVHNPGPAIPADDLPHIFERFYRADKARTHKENTSGYGLGLAIAKSIAEDHNGTIQCTSTDENGTTFTVRFRERLR
jgi:signal transduction histidine kinase